MRVRLDIHGRPKPATQPSKSQPTQLQPTKSQLFGPPSSPAPLDHLPCSHIPPPIPTLPPPSPPPPSPPPPPPPPPSPPSLLPPSSSAPPPLSALASPSISTTGCPPVSSPAPSSPPTPPIIPPPSSSTPPQPFERSSDSGSSAAEAYNSEDEHPHPARNPVFDVPVRTIREREAHFAAQLASKGMRIIEMRPDGNCLFRALAHSVWSDAERHATLRSTIMQYLMQERDYFSQFVAEDFVRYLRRKSRDGTHGNHLELQAAAELFGRPIEVYSYSDTPTNVIESWGTPVDPSAVAPEPIRVSFHRGSHYNAVQHLNPSEKSNRRTAAAAAAAAGAAAEQVQIRAAEDARATQDEMERAVLALSLVEATCGYPAAGSASSSVAAVPNTVLALVNAGYPEELAYDAYRVAGHGGLSEMVRYLSFLDVSVSHCPRMSSAHTAGGAWHGREGCAGATSMSVEGKSVASSLPASQERDAGCSEAGADVPADNSFE